MACPYSTSLFKLLQLRLRLHPLPSILASFFVVVFNVLAYTHPLEMADDYLSALSYTWATGTSLPGIHLVVDPDGSATDCRGAVCTSFCDKILEKAPTIGQERHASRCAP